ncbi:mycofactocin oligosaccharide methyltransferase MftM [Prauserella halophila]|uniref:Mycofactocin oligosaccharide methyltransferase MftM n=1 Tax=Prauserella halophila TaxID=185641 RepID=A0ABN1W309_9PSEU|nr:mycofactocin oligosaccharide methyltransferase MftM [Prauserella halophila]MCP2236229.1 Methyltransferase domain-containing protein [Prauserella halophila]
MTSPLQDRAHTAPLNHTAPLDHAAPVDDAAPIGRAVLADDTASLDPLAPCSPGEYRDERVRVVHRGGGLPGSPLGPVVARTPHFRLHGGEARLVVSHRLGRGDVDDALTALLVEELFRPGLVAEQELFERVVVGLVRSTVPGGLAAWRTFYRTTLARLRTPARGPAGGLAPVYEYARRLVPPGRVLDLGSCFGFFPLLLAAEPGYAVTASDVVAGSMRLLSRIAGAEGVPLSTLACDAASVPLRGGAADTVTVLHLLEHLDPDAGAAVLAEAIRLAARRVVVAVPFEDEPDACFGHVRRFDRAELVRLGTRTGLPFTVAEHHGGWLVVETAPGA